MLTQAEFDAGTREVAASRYVATKDFWGVVSGCDFDPESFVPVDPNLHGLGHAIKGDTEFATDDKHGPLHGPLIAEIVKSPAPRVKTNLIGEVFLARRVVVPRRNLTVWVYPPESESSLREYHSTGNLL